MSRIDSDENKSRRRYLLPIHRVGDPENVFCACPLAVISFAYKRARADIFAFSLIKVIAMNCQIAKRDMVVRNASIYGPLERFQRLLYSITLSKSPVAIKSRKVNTLHRVYRMDGRGEAKKGG